jgi:hypothetical protein
VLCPHLFVILVLIGSNMAAAASAKTFRVGRCQVDVPEAWHGTSSADYRTTLVVSEAPTASAAVALIKGLGATALPDDGATALLTQSKAVGGGLIVKFYSVTKTTPACTADVTVNGGDAHEGQAVAVSLRSN